MKVAVSSVALSSREMRKTRVFGDFSTNSRKRASSAAVAGGRSSINGRMSMPFAVDSL